MSLRSELTDKIIMCVECGEVNPPKLDEDGDIMNLQQRLESHVRQHMTDDKFFNEELTRLMRVHMVYRYQPAKNLTSGITSGWDSQ